MIREAIPSDFLAIDSLRKKEGDSLGFIPKDAYISVLEKRRVANRDRWKTQEILICEDDGEVTGFAYTSFYGNEAKIIQLVIREDARRWERATRLESMIRDKARQLGKDAILCRVAFDLEANYFWKALGYMPIKQVHSTWLNQRASKTKRPLWIYLLDLGLPLFDRPLETR